MFTWMTSLCLRKPGRNSVGSPGLSWNGSGKHKLYLKAEKCEFEREQIEYLGLIISHNKVAMDPVEVAAGSGMATASGEEGGSILPWIRELLPTVH